MNLFTEEWCLPTTKCSTSEPSGIVSGAEFDPDKAEAIVSSGHTNDIIRCE